MNDIEPAAELARVIRVVAVSPGDVLPERDALTLVVDELNRWLAPARGVRLDLWRWETHAAPDHHPGGPQAVIDGMMSIADADVVIGIMWKHFGTPTGGAASGTEHELRRACAASDQQRGRPRVMVYFCNRPAYPTRAELDQWRQVLDFRDAMSAQMLSWQYTDVTEFAPVVALDVFDEDTAVDYLVGRAGRKGDRQGARRLARELGCLPLALCHAGAFCALGTSFDEYREMLDELPVDDLFANRPEVWYAETVASTWQVSIATVEKQASLAPAVLAMAAHLGPDAIPVSLFEALIEPQSGREPRLRDALNELARFSLVAVDEGNVSVHRLVQKTVRDAARARDDRSAGRMALEALAHAFPDDQSLPAVWAVCEQLLAHVLAIGETVVAPTADDAISLVRLRTRASRYLLSAGQRARAVGVAQRTVELAERMLGEHRETMTARIRLADAYQWAGRTHEALALAERVAEDCKRALDGEDPISLAARAQLVLSYQWDGRHRDALELAEQVVAARMRVLGKEHRDTLAAYVELSWTYGDLGRYEEAIAMKRRALAQHERVLGRDHPTTLVDRASLAFSLRAAERLPEAIDLFERTAEQRDRLLGPEHPDTLWTYANLAKAYELVGRTDEAISIQERVLPATRRVLGISHHDTLSSRFYLASAHLAAGRIDVAIELNERVVADRERIMGVMHPDAIDARAQLASSFHAKGRTEEALAIQEQVLADAELVRGPEHPHTRRARAHLRAYRSAAHADGGGGD